MDDQRRFGDLGFFCLVVAVLSVVSVAWAHETPLLIPKGISRARVVGVLTETIQNKFDSQGDVHGITSNLNRSVTTADFISKQPELGTLVGVLNNLEPGLGQKMLNANLYSNFKVNASIVMPAFEYGISDRLTVGVRLPIVRKSVSHEFTAQSVNNALAIAQGLGGLSPEIQAGLAKVGSLSLNNEFFEQSLFTSKGYLAPRSFETTDIGDLEWGAKFQTLKTNSIQQSMTLGLRAPTGRVGAIDNPFDTGSGNGAWATLLQADQALFLGENFQIGCMGKLTFHFEDERRRAVPKDAFDSLPSLMASDGQVQNVTRRQPVKWDTEVYTGYKLFGQTFEIWTAYLFTAKGKDDFEGAASDRLYYPGLAVGTDQVLHSWSVGIEFSTIPWFRAKTFAIPMQLYAFYNTPLSGKNVNLGPFGRMDLKFYF